mmetsp:Transcript_33921/g.59874  ORF Transcript_33921/g.59874 Transcript_33921/m.59874 type:complete len:178 (-) Transcript_33921:106-639(-)
MGGTASGPDKAPARIVPTSTQLRRAKLTSTFWTLQADGQASVPQCLEAYGKPYAVLLETHCGQHRRDHQRCVKSKKLDPFNMSAWYPDCGEPFELENACAAGLLAEVDRRCKGPLDRAAGAVLAAKGDQADSRLQAPLSAVGKCVEQVAAAKGLKVEYDAAAARQGYESRKRLIARM